MTDQERETYVLDYYEGVNESEKQLLRLLKLTKESKSGIVQDLRKEIQKYAKNTEKYISEIEMNNIELTERLREVEKLYNLHLFDLKAGIVK